MSKDELTPADWKYFFDQVGALRAYAVECSDTAPFILTPEDVWRASRNGIVVVPLHMAPQAEHDRTQDGQDDPEPRDVGHPEYEDAHPSAPPSDECTCDHPGWGHGYAGCGTIVDPEYDDYRAYCKCTWDPRAKDRVQR